MGYKEMITGDFIPDRNAQEDSVEPASSPKDAF